MQSVRQSLDLDATCTHAGIEGASNLFYYLFDDWRAVYSSIATYRKRLEALVRLYTQSILASAMLTLKQQGEILGDMVSALNRP